MVDRHLPLHGRLLLGLTPRGLRLAPPLRRHLPLRGHLLRLTPTLRRNLLLRLPPTLRRHLLRLAPPLRRHLSLRGHLLRLTPRGLRLPPALGRHLLGLAPPLRRHLALRGHLLLLLPLLLLHLLLVRLRSGLHEAAARLHAHSHAHEGDSGPGLVRTGGLHAAGDRPLDVALADRGVGEHRALVAHIDELAGLVVVGDRGDADRLDLHAAAEEPVVVEGVAHVLRELAHLRGDLGNADPVDAHLIDRGLERFEELRHVLLFDVVDVHADRVPGDRLLVEQDRVGDADREGAVAAQEEFGVVEGVEVVEGVRRAELDALDLLEVDVEDLLLLGGSAPELEALPRIHERPLEVAREDRRQAGVVDAVHAGLGREVGDPAAVGEDHRLIVVDVDDRTVRHDVVGAPAVRVPAIVCAKLRALGEDDPLPHIDGLESVEILIAEIPADGGSGCLDESHDRDLPC